MSRPQPYESYQGIQVFLYQEVGRKPDEWGASIRWHRRLIDVEVEQGLCPTRENLLAAAHQLIDLLQKDGEEERHPSRKDDEDTRPPSYPGHARYFFHLSSALRSPLTAFAGTIHSRKRRSRMACQPDAEQIKQESVRAALQFFALPPIYPRQLIMRELALSKEEHTSTTHKLSVVLGSLGQYRAFASRRVSGCYTAEEEREVLEGQAEEIRRVLFTAACYLEQNLRRVENVFIEDCTPLLLETAPYNAWWMIHLDEECCHVVRSQHGGDEGNPEYTILEP